MGALCSLRNKPKTEKASNDQRNDKLKCGDSSMQGWRLSQEDAHNCILDYDADTSLFAVYDGHGGHEVAVYCSQKLPDFIKNFEPYKAGDYEKALMESFLAFDATLTTSEVLEELKQIQKPDAKAENESSSSDVEENINNLYEEASMPIEEVMEKYTSNLKNDELHNSEESKQSKSPNKNNADEVCSSSGECSRQNIKGCPKVSGSIHNGDIKESETASTNEDQNNTIKELDNEKPEVNAGGDQQNNNTEEKLASDKEQKVDIKAGGDAQKQHSEEHLPSEDKKEESTKEGDEISKKGKGKALAKTKGVVVTPEKKVRPKRSAKSLYNKLLETFESESDSEDEDETFQGPIEENSSEEDVNTSLEANSEVSSEVEEEEDEDEDDDEDLEEEGLDDDESITLCDNPGFDSGCTAVIALIHKNQLYVANAGDSRCVLCRNGKAVVMSLDHTPRGSKEEYERIKKAGGRVCSEGRINGGLNLSRAIGDHSYKQNKDLSEREQMIIALPDVRTMTINPAEDEFMILACDGIWDCMSRQEVVDFIKPKLKESPEKLSKICEELFDNCLAKTSLDRGIDNMTAVIVQFLNPSCRRSPPSDDENAEKATKRLKTDETTESTALSSTAPSCV